MDAQGIVRSTRLRHQSALPQNPILIIKAPYISFPKNLQVELSPSGSMETQLSDDTPLDNFVRLTEEGSGAYGLGFKGVGF